MNRILITGGSGFLGSRISYFYRRKAEGKISVFTPAHREMDFTSLTSARDYLLASRPEVVFHCGGIADTEYVRTHPEEGYHINVEGTANLAQLTGEMGIPMIFTSSDYVYQGKTIAGKEYCRQTDELYEEEASSENEYGIQKLEAEKRCLTANPLAVVLRLTWMYDIPRRGVHNKDNFIVNLFHAEKEKQPLRFACHEYRGLTDVWQVVKNLEKAISLPTGTYNFGCTNSLPTIKVAELAAHLLGLSSQIVEEDRERFAERPRNITMSGEKLRGQGITFGSTEEGLRRFIKENFPVS